MIIYFYEQHKADEFYEVLILFFCGDFFIEISWVFCK